VKVIALKTVDMMFQKRPFDLGFMFFVFFALGFLSLGGCSENQSAEREQSNLKPLSVFYGQYVGQHRGQLPPNEQEFKKYLQTIKKERLASMQVKSVDELLVSSRDGKPYVIIYAPPLKSGAEPPSTTVVAYEQEGKGGTRFIARLLGAIEEVDEAKFKEIVTQAK
jgi:hypothetical protein